MEKTLARMIYKRMKIGERYSSRELYDLLDEEEYYDFIYANAPELYGKDIRKVVSSEMWKVVNAGYATTHTEQATLANIRGLRKGATPTSYTTYTIRYWVRVR